MTTATTSKNGAVVIPSDIRKKYGLKQGDKVSFIDYGGVISIVRAPEDPIKASRGILKGGPTRRCRFNGFDRYVLH